MAGEGNRPARGKNAAVRGLLTETVTGVGYADRAMKNPNFLLLYVKDVAASAAFYSRLLGRPAIDSSENFAMMPLTEGVMLGLWRDGDIQPPAAGKAGGFEIGLPVSSDDEVEQSHRDFAQHGIAILQPPTRMDFGYTFVGADPDGYRLRVTHVPRP